MRIAAQPSTQAATAAETRQQAKLADAAQQFEAMLMQEMLKPMQAGQDSWGGKRRPTTLPPIPSAALEPKP